MREAIKESTFEFIYFVAKENQIEVLYSENLQHNQNSDGVKIADPLLS